MEGRNKVKASILGIKKIVVTCPYCGHRQRHDFDTSTWFNQVKCKNKECYEIYLLDKDGKGELATGSFVYHKYKEPTAFGYNKKTGRPVAIDKKGKQFDPKETRYDLNRDPHGWRSTGKK